MIKFALKCSRDPQSVTKDEHDLLRRQGFTQSQIAAHTGKNEIGYLMGEYRCTTCGESIAKKL